LLCLRFEGGGHAIPENTSLCLLGSPTMSDLDDKFSVDIAVQWFDIFLAALDCYVWVFGEKYTLDMAIPSPIMNRRNIYPKM
jgi:hypothetical protein